MHDAVRLLPSIVGVLIRSRLELRLEDLALRHQVTVLQRQRRMRPWLTPIDRALWVWLYRLWSRNLESSIIVKPETVIRWHRGGLSRYWRWRSRPRGPGRPAVSPEIRGRIRRMSRENPLRGAFRANLGRYSTVGTRTRYQRSDATNFTISEILSRSPLKLFARHLGTPGGAVWPRLEGSGWGRRWCWKSANRIGARLSASAQASAMRPEGELAVIMSISVRPSGRPSCSEEQISCPGRAPATGHRLLRAPLCSRSPRRHH